MYKFIERDEWSLSKKAIKKRLIGILKKKKNEKLIFLHKCTIF